MKKVPNCSIHNSITVLGRDKVLLGRCWGPGPQLKSVEFLFLPNVVHELQSILYVKPLKNMLHFMGSGPSPTADSRLKLHRLAEAQLKPFAS